MCWVYKWLSFWYSIYLQDLLIFLMDKEKCSEESISGEYTPVTKEIKELCNMEQKWLYGRGKISVICNCGPTYVLYWWGEIIATSAAATWNGEGGEAHRESSYPRERGQRDYCYRDFEEGKKSQLVRWAVSGWVSIPSLFW